MSLKPIPDIQRRPVLSGSRLRSFETVTYMLDGHMLHEDHMGNRGDLRPGDVQWMTAGRGIIHSEMPQQREGRMRGFQLWLNLPAREKMKPWPWRFSRAASWCCCPDWGSPAFRLSPPIAGKLYSRLRLITY